MIEIVETLRITHKNLLNEAANLKAVHEKVEELKKNYLAYKRIVHGDNSNPFDTENTENSN